MLEVSSLLSPWLLILPAFFLLIHLTFTLPASFLLTYLTQSPSLSDILVYCIVCTCLDLLLNSCLLYFSLGLGQVGTMGDNEPQEIFLTYISWARTEPCLRHQLLYCHLYLEVS